MKRFKPLCVQDAGHYSHISLQCKGSVGGLQLLRTHLNIHGRLKRPTVALDTHTRELDFTSFETDFESTVKIGPVIQLVSNFAIYFGQTL